MNIKRLFKKHISNFKSLTEAFPSDQEMKWLIISPHDDDAVIGMGLTLIQASSERIDSSVLIVTDGSMGYGLLEDLDNIIDIRKKETLEGYAILGIGPERILRLEYPDANLGNFRGRYSANTDNILNNSGFGGLLNSLVFQIRKINPTHVFINTCFDPHPDHKVVAEEATWACLLSSENIWPELGDSCATLDIIFYAVYRGFAEQPSLQLSAINQHLEKKLESISAWKSQKQIVKLVENIKAAGPIEYLQERQNESSFVKDYARLFEI